MIFTKSAFSIKIQKTMEFHSIFRKPERKKTIKIDLKKHSIVFEHRMFNIFSSILAPFWIPKLIEKSQFFEKMRFEGLLRSSIALKLLFEWILEPSELDFHGF